MGFDDIIKSAGAMGKQFQALQGSLNAMSKFQIPDFKASLAVPSLKMPKLRNPQLTQMIRDERDKINAIITAIYYNTEQISNFKKRIETNPESSDLVLVSIIISLFLIVFCVAIPLLVMPVGKVFSMEFFIKQLSSNIFSLKGFFVAILTLFVSAIFIIFGWKNHKMKYSKDDLKRLENCTEIENYSKYLKNYVENVSQDLH